MQLKDMRFWPFETGLCLLEVASKTYMTVVRFTNSIYPDEAAHYELPHLDLHCLSYCL